MKEFSEVKSEVFKRSKIRKIKQRNNIIMGVTAVVVMSYVLVVTIPIVQLFSKKGGLTVKPMAKTYCADEFFDCQPREVLRETVGMSVKGNGLAANNLSNKQEEKLLAILKDVVTKVREQGVEAGVQFDNSSTSVYVNMIGENGAERTVIISDNLVRDELGVWYSYGSDSTDSKDATTTLQDDFEKALESIGVKK